MNYFIRSLTFYSLLYSILGMACAAMGVLVFQKNNKSRLSFLFLIFCVGVFFWMIPISLLNIGVFDLNKSIFLSKITFTSIVLLPTIALHFAIEFLGPYNSNRAKNDLKIAYVLTISFFMLLWTTPYFVIGLKHYSWGAYPEGGPIHRLHAAFVFATAVYVVLTLWTGLKRIQSAEGKGKKYNETMLFFLAFFFATISCSDFLHSWGFDYFPIGAICMTFFITCITYGIFRHNLLGVSLAIRKSLLYSMILSIISALYFLVVYVTGLFIGNAANSNSPFLNIFVMTVSVIIFKPLEHTIQKAIDKLFCLQPREIIEKENALFKQEMVKQDRMKAVATLAAGMAHEIKNPLTAIKTFAEYLPKKYDDPDFRVKFSRIVSDEVERVNNILKQLLEFSKPDNPQLKPVLISDLLEETLSLLTNNLLRKEIELHKELDPYCMILGDRNQLKQAFLNLLLNAIQAIPNKGQLKVTSRTEPDGYAKTSITDTGCGMSQEQQRHIFDPFYTTKEDGTGLGLAIVHSIITKHGGKIEIQSEAGKGTTVSVFLKSRD